MSYKPEQDTRYYTPHRLKIGSRSTIYKPDGCPIYLSSITSLQFKPEGILFLTTTSNKSFEVRIVNRTDS